MGGIGTADVVLLGILGLVAYFIGNISPSTIMAKRQGIDIKKEGSGNAGTTNALRVMGKKAGAITCIVDILKGVVAVLIGMLIGGPAAAYLCALCVFLGHVWPIVYRFQGGKGVDIEENVRRINRRGDCLCSVVGVSRAGIFCLCMCDGDNNADQAPGKHSETDTRRRTYHGNLREEG